MDSGELETIFCPTEPMCADMLNKPKQGAAFRKDRAVLMNIPAEHDDEAERKATHPALLGGMPKEGPAKAQTHAVLRRRSVLEQDEGKTARSVLRPGKRARAGSADLTSHDGRGGHVAWREPLVVA